MWFFAWCEGPEKKHGLKSHSLFRSGFCNFQLNVLSHSICLHYKKAITCFPFLLPTKRNRRQRLVASIQYDFSEYLLNTAPHRRPLSGCKRKGSVPGSESIASPRHKTIWLDETTVYSSVWLGAGKGYRQWNRLSKTFIVSIHPKVDKAGGRAQQYRQGLFLFIHLFWHPWCAGLLPQIFSLMVKYGCHSPGITSLYYCLQNKFSGGKNGVFSHFFFFFNNREKCFPEASIRLTLSSRQPGSNHQFLPKL